MRYNSNKYVLILPLLIAFFLLIFGSNNYTSANTILLQEDFNDNNVHDGSPTNWDEITGSAPWTLVTGEYIGTIAPNNTPPISLTGDLAWKNYSVEVDVRSIEGVDRHILFRFTQYHVKGYSVKFRNEDLGVTGLIELQKHGQNVVLQTNSLFKTHIGETHRFKITAIDNHIRVYVDNIENPLIDYVDNNQPILDGRVGFEIEPSGIGVTTKTGYDNLVVTDLSPSNTLNVPDIKQYSLPWGPLEYDSASKWKPVVTDISIDRWGCALTSGTMILNFYGYPFTPQAMNEWFTGAGKGYSNGSILWPKVAQFTKSRMDLDKDQLEFKYKSPSTTILDEELDAGRPVVLKYASYNEKGEVVKSHFVVAKGKQGNDYLVNDPDSSTNTTMSEVNSSWGIPLVQIGTFTPSHTDVSYFIFEVDYGFNVELYDQSGNRIEGDYIVEGPITASDKVTPSGNGKSYQTLYIAKPDSGSYKVKVTGNGAYDLTSHFLDTEGGDEVESFSGIVNTGQTDVYTINFNKNLASDSKVVEISFEALLASLDTAYKNKLIKDKLGYFALRTLIDVGRIEYSKDKIVLAKKSLALAKLLLQKAKPSQIDTTIKNNLILQINTLISTL